MKRKILLIVTFTVVALITCSCRKNETVDSQQITTAPVGTEENVNNSASGFPGELLEESEDTNSETTEDAKNDSDMNEEIMPDSVEQNSQDQSTGGGIPEYSGESDLLEPPANSSAGVL